jgi:AcrR family transcriptional regulator
VSAGVGASGGAGQIRKVGRPRAFEDADVFDAIRLVLIRDGFYELTLSAVANQLGVSTPALARRFGDKHEMFEAYLDYSDAKIAGYLEQLKDEFDSPLDSLRARWRIPVRNTPDEYEGRDGVAAWVEFLLCVRTDPSYGAMLETRTRAWEDGVTERLEAAYHAGEIGEVDFAMLAHVLCSAMTGAMLFWFEHRRGDLWKEIAAIFDFVIGPYRTISCQTATANGQRAAAAD